MGRFGAEGDNYETKAVEVIYAYEGSEESMRKRESQKLTAPADSFDGVSEKERRQTDEVRASRTRLQRKGAKSRLSARRRPGRMQL